MSGNAREAGRSTIDRMLSLLDALDRRKLTLTDIAERSQIPVTTASRILATLERWGGVERGEDGTYQVGLRLWEIGARASAASVFREAARPALADLARLAGESAQLAVLDRDSALVIECVQDQRATPIATRIGRRLPLHATAVGRVLLAHADPSFQRNVLAGSLPRFTAYTQVMPGRLTAELRHIQQKGISLLCEELTLGHSSLAAPVRDDAGRVVAAVGVVSRTRPSISRLEPTLRSAARRIEARLSASEESYVGATSPSGALGAGLRRPSAPTLARSVSPT